LVDVGVGDLVTHKVEEVRCGGHRHKSRHQIDSLELLVDSELFKFVAQAAVDGARLVLGLKEVKVLQNDLL